MARPHPEWRSNDVLTPEQQRRLARDMQAALDQVRTGIISLDARTQMQLSALFESASTALSRGLRAPADPQGVISALQRHQRSEARRVGKECGRTCRSRGSVYH